MKIISWNVNGIRACAKKGFINYLEKESPDILCIQETKAREEDVPEELIAPLGYHSLWHSAEKRGYSGVGIYTKIKPESVIYGMGNSKYDSEGRILQINLDTFTLFNVYFPNGQMNDERLQYKLDFYHDFFAHCQELRRQGGKIIICGDYNTAHKEIDLANPKANSKVSGFLPIEREWMDKVVDMGYIDTFRQYNKEPEQYSWWSYRSAARGRNIGWRIDYFFLQAQLKSRLKNAFIQQNVMGSDHCPVGIELA